MKFSLIFTARKRSLGQGNIFTPVCHSVHGGGGVCLSACWDMPPGPGTTPLGPGTPSGPCTPQHHAPPSTEHAGRYSQCVGGTHPTGLQSCLLKNICLLFFQ